MKFIRGVDEAQDLHGNMRFPAVFICSAPHSDEQVCGGKAIPTQRVAERVPGTIP